ncbi:unnamed protein product [Ostreobium quekettii]|uniref:BUD13 homolog n=1 Tax=Ostreobium quekettii TaxID=121088 RepID=A0A8S1JDH6_9CHLO|nr:unnamed protein product [Ostreobium quekettii]
MFEGMSVLRKEERERSGPSEEAKALSRYLESKYAGGDARAKKVKKKKRARQNITVRDMDVSGFEAGAGGAGSDGEDEKDEAPVIANPEEAELLKRQTEKAKRYYEVGNGGAGWTKMDQDNGEDGAMLHRKRKPRHDSPDQSPQRRKSVRHDSPDQSPPRRKAARHDSQDPSPPRRKAVRHDSPDQSPPRRRAVRHDSPDLSPPRRKAARHNSPDLSPPRRKAVRHDSPDQSPPRRKATRHYSPDQSPPRRKGARRASADLSPPRRKAARHDSTDLSLPRTRGDRQEGGTLITHRHGTKRPPAMADGTTAGMVSGQQLRQDLEKKRRQDKARLLALDAGQTGEGAETVYRDAHGRRMSLEELKEKRAKEQKQREEQETAPWGSGLLQQREMERRRVEMQREAAKPFARSRDDKDLDEMYRTRTRFGDPMAQFTKKRQLTDEELAPPVITDSMRQFMNKSGFVVPQDVPPYSWLKRGVAPPTNRYNIRPGRHWDGVVRTNGFEQEFLKQLNEKKALEKEAMMWSVEDM